MATLGEFGYRQELNRALSTRDLVIYGLIFMVPIAPYSPFGFVWEQSKGMVPLAYFIGLVGMVFTAMSYAQMSRAFPVAGSVYTYAQRGLHEVAGFFSGWLILLDYILVPALLYLFSAAALQPLFPTVPVWMWSAGFISFNAVVNLLGIQFTAKLNRYLLLLQLVVLVWFVVMGLFSLYHGAGAGGLTLRPIYNPQVFSLSMVVGATSIAVLSFLGFDGISTLAEEARGGGESVGRAVLLSLLLVGVLFMVQTWVAADLAEGMKFSSPDAAFYQIAQRAGGVWLRAASSIAVVIACAIANAIAAQAAVSRILFAMARDGKLPSIFAKVHPRFKTPYVSTLIVAIVSLVAAVLMRMDDLSRIVNFGALTSFLLLHLSVVNHFFIKGRSGRWLQHLICPMLGAAVIGFVLYEMDMWAKIVGVCWVGVGIVYYLVLTLVMKKPVELEI